MRGTLYTISTLFFFGFLLAGGCVLSPNPQNHHYPNFHAGSPIFWMFCCALLGMLSFVVGNRFTHDSASASAPLLGVRIAIWSITLAFGLFGLPSLTRSQPFAHPDTIFAIGITLVGVIIGISIEKIARRRRSSRVDQAREPRRT